MNDKKPVYLLAIESSCDDTSAAVSCNNRILSNVICNQSVHEKFGGVVPELASRAHQQNIIPTVKEALLKSGIDKSQLSAIVYTRGPGLLGSLIVGSSFAKSMAMSLQVPLIEVNHMQAHILAHFILNVENQLMPEFPFLCLTVSGGHTQIVRVTNYLEMEIIGQTLDDAAGEAFDKVAKIMGLPYPGGPVVDKLANEGNADSYKFPHPMVADLNFSFSGLKTSFLNFIKKNQSFDNSFIENNKANICASIQKTIIEILMDKLTKAAVKNRIKDIAIAGGVSANSGLRKALSIAAQTNNWRVFIPRFEHCTDNAAMIAIAGYYKFHEGKFSSLNAPPLARYSID